MAALALVLPLRSNGRNYWRSLDTSQACRLAGHRRPTLADGFCVYRYGRRLPGRNPDILARRSPFETFGQATRRTGESAAIAESTMEKTIALIMAASALVFSGCVPAPAVDERSPAVSGRVVDAVTGHPIKGATVMLHAHPSYKAHTDSDGAYRIRARHNVRLFLTLGICGGEIPEGDYYNADQLEIVHPLYERRQIKTDEFLVSFKNGTQLVLRDVPLTPAPKP